MITDKEKQLGHCKKLSIDIISPMPIKGMEIDFNNLSIFCGANGAGKTLILKLVWAFGSCINNHLIAIANGIQYDLVPAMQFIMDNTFDNQNFDGDIKIDFERGSMSVKLESGKVKDVVLSIAPNVEFGSQPIYMSTDIRLFNNIVKYLKLKNAFGINRRLDKFTEDDMKKLLSSYKLYDLLYIEMLIRGITDGAYSKTEPQYGVTCTHLNKALTGFDEHFKINTLEVDDVAGDIFYSDDKVSKQSVTMLGNGHQSLLNMILCTTMFS